MGIPWDDLSNIGFPGLVTLFVLLVFLGYLVPGKQAKEWKDLYLRERASREDMQDMMGLLRKVLRALPKPPEEDD